ncbi:hypothetical protein BC936DRAFT_145293 [Jimgerdemannia flammicorona]|uniref:Uncharacterized protein n=1 Tax=Jimgerdemannia flammicorona TaxID=994334 RepID=A0A433DAF4_9FUNG|nr:hypothetical protein BC936DRAFT_145293 [Jimgerdemannia flammicorona]
MLQPNLSTNPWAALLMNTSTILTPNTYQVSVPTNERKHPSHESRLDVIVGIRGDHRGAKDVRWNLGEDNSRTDNTSDGEVDDDNDEEVGMQATVEAGPSINTGLVAKTLT